ncbi:MAG: transposase [Terriglobia bacterium]
MAKPPHDRSIGLSRTFFVSAKTWQSRALFRSERLAQLFTETLLDYRAQGKYRLHEFVLMPDHFHLLLTPAPGVTLERALQFIKGGFSHRAGRTVSRTLEIWQRGYVDHRVRDENDYLHHRDYIRLNPVRAHLAAAPEDYRYGSAHRSFQLDAPPQGLKPSTW